MMMMIMMMIMTMTMKRTSSFILSRELVRQKRVDAMHGGETMIPRQGLSEESLNTFHMS